MGCFSSVCIVSKLPIYEQPVVGLPIVKQKNSSGGIRCYPNAEWELDGFPFFGDNDSYGRIEGYEKGKYHSLNKALYGDLSKDTMDIYGNISKNTMDEWCQPKGDKSIMFIHRAIWDEIILRWREQAETLYKTMMARENFDGKLSRKSWEKTIKMFPGKGLEKRLDEIIRKVPSFRYDGTGVSHKFSMWCNEHYSPLVKKALMDLVAFSVSCTYTHTLYTPTYTLSEQIADWKEEVSWHQFVTKFAVTEEKRLLRDM